MDNTRLVLTIGTAQFLLPADVQIAETIKRFQGMQVIEVLSYGRNPQYKATGPARVSVEIVSAEDLMLAEPETRLMAQPPAPVSDNEVDF